MIQSGTIDFGEGLKSSPEWSLHKMPGDPMGDTREDFLSADIPFPQRFGGKPTVVLSLAGVGAMIPPTDLIGSTFQAGVFHVQLDAEDVQREEFNIRIRAFRGTVLQSVRVTWIAHDES